MMMMIFLLLSVVFTPVTAQKALGDDCADDNSCSVEKAKCRLGKCVCDLGYKPDAQQQCEWIEGMVIGKKCAVERECGEWCVTFMKCLKTCECIKGYSGELGERCTPSTELVELKNAIQRGEQVNPVVGSPCKQPYQCGDPCELHMDCDVVNQKCKCREGFTGQEGQPCAANASTANTTTPSALASTMSKSNTTANPKKSTKKHPSSRISPKTKPKVTTTATKPKSRGNTDKQSDMLVMAVGLVTAFTARYMAFILSLLPMATVA